MAIATFNLKARNIVSEANDQIRMEKTNSEVDTNHKTSEACRKIKKLSSQ